MELKQYLMVIRKKFWLIAAIVIVICGLAGVKSILYTTPIYEANAKIIVNQTSQSNGTTTMNYTDVQTNIMLINSYKEIIKSAAIMNKVKEEYPDIKESPAVMAYSISVSAANQSQVMNLTYRDTSYKEAAKIVNAIATVFKHQIPSIMKVDNITILNEANENDNPGPVNTNPVMTILIAFLLSVLLSLGIVFLLDYLDNSYKTAREVEADLGLPVLASVFRIKRSDRKHQISSHQQKVGDGAYAASIN